MSQVGVGFGGRYFQATTEHLTFDQGTYIGWDNIWGDDNCSISLINSVLTGVSGDGIWHVYTNAVVELATNSGVYQTAWQ